MILRLNPELSRKVWKLAYPIILANLSLTLKEMAQCGQVLDNSLVLALILGGVFTLLSPWLAHFLPPHLESGTTMGRLLGTYIQYRFYGVVFVLLNLAFGGFFNGIGKTKVRMKGATILTIANILLNYLLIFGKLGFPRLGVQGAALASTLATGLLTFYYLVVSSGKRYRSEYKYFHLLNIDFSKIRDIGKLSLPLMCRSFIGVGGFLVFFWIIGRIGTLELATSNILRSLYSLSYMLGAAMGAAATTLVGQNMGAERYGRAEAFGWEAVKLGMMAMGTLGVLFIVVSGWRSAILVSSICRWPGF
jgi:putative MATE family efflux protein